MGMSAVGTQRWPQLPLPAQHEDKKAWAALSASLQDLAKRKGVPADKKPLELLKVGHRPGPRCEQARSATFLASDRSVRSDALCS